MRLTEQSCGPIEAGAEPMSPEEASELASHVPEWGLREGGLERDLTFEGFSEAMRFVNAVAELAREEDHHPRICVDYDTVELSLTTHSIGGLSMNDFIMAAKIDELLQ
ncbi:MAG: 4a-hydroxytetrahydrobiopterin dehydratase [Armatimonadota bacterium]